MNKHFALGLLVATSLGCGDKPETANQVDSVSPDPDLVLTQLAAPAAAQNGEQIAVSYTVCNVGGTYVGNTEIELYLSNDDVFSPDDTPIGMGTVNDLDLDVCRSGTVDAWVWAPLDGEYHIIGLVDPMNNVIEGDETNNELVSDVIGVGNNPDLFVESITAPPTADSTFLAEVVVCNQGNMPASSSHVNLYASVDEIITGMVEDPMNHDEPIGGEMVDTLEPGQCRTISVPAYAPAPMGTTEYFLGAIVDEDGYLFELIESNNHFTGGIIGFGFGPDLVVSTLSGPPSADGQFQVDLTVCNQGTAQAMNADVALYASVDETIEGIVADPMNHDPDIGWASIPALNVGQCHSETVDAWAPPVGPDTAFFLGAIVDENNMVMELVESNNNFLGGIIGIGQGPDLLVSALSGPPTADGAFDVDITVCNQGTVMSNNTEVEIYLSEDTVILPGPTGDLGIGYAMVQQLNPGECQTQTANTYGGAPSPGTTELYLAAIVDPMDNQVELLESNNTFVGDIIGIGQEPDLVVTAIEAPPSADQNFDVLVTVCNQGTQDASGSDVVIYASEDAIITPWTPNGGGDYGLGNAQTPHLVSGQCATLTVQSMMPPLPPEATELFLGAIVDEMNNLDELVESNNTFLGGVMGFGSGPDFIITDIVAPAAVDQQFQVTVTICNQGTMGGSPNGVGVYASEDDEITTMFEDMNNHDYALGGESVPFLEAGACQNVVIQAFPPPVGPDETAFFLGAAVDEDAMSDELVESNNEYVDGLIGIGYGPDLIVTAISAPPTADNQFSVDVTVCNQGTGMSSFTDFGLYASLDTAITGGPMGGDELIGNGPIPDLNPGACWTETIVAYAPPPGPDTEYFLGAIVDEYNNLDELIESNNTFLGGIIGLGSGPDFAISVINGPVNNVGPGYDFTVATTICNQGTNAAGMTEFALFASSDQTITGGPDGDSFLGYRSIPSLDAGQCDTADMLITGVYLDEGDFYLGGIVDEMDYEMELVESNNTLVGSVLHISHIYCGNGMVDQGAEECDDGNQMDGDGCDSQCVVEFCGDGIVNNGGEQCDDGNQDDGDGCNASCISEFCGDGIVNNNGNEQCDDGNTDDGDGCSAACEVEYCGDGVVNNLGLEECDDGNYIDGDGCNASCMLEVCGDGIVNNAGSEECDDGNSVDGDGCSAACTIEGTQYPWQDNAHGTLGMNMPWNYALGYHFTPQVDGVVTELGGFFDGTKMVRLFEKDSGDLLAEVEATAANDWGYAEIGAVPVQANTTYTVAVYMAGSGGSYRIGTNNFPQTFGDVRIEGTTYTYTGSDPDARPTNTYTYAMYGQADIRFIPMTAPWQENAYGDERTGINWNYAMGYHFTPQVDGVVTALGGLFDGTKTIRLFNKATGDMLAETTATSANDWAYGDVDAVFLSAGETYTVAVYLAGSGGSYRRLTGDYLPKTFGLLTIEGSTYASLSGNPDARPINNVTSIMFGQADVRFAPLP